MKIKFVVVLTLILLFSCDNTFVDAVPAEIDQKVFKISSFSASLPRKISEANIVVEIDGVKEVIDYEVYVEMAEGVIRQYVIYDTTLSEVSWSLDGKSYSFDFSKATVIENKLKFNQRRGELRLNGSKGEVVFDMRMRGKAIRLQNTSGSYDLIEESDFTPPSQSQTELCNGAVVPFLF
ncbi:MAG: hypothetical protein JXR63_02505 [Spirochaetales bacterium]|nr:hypothetical protein [Spirochaetales bacterium]